MKAFVGVRVAEIQSTWDPTNWRLVPTNLNPADDLSRGLTVAQLNDRWIYGSSFLKGAPDTWPTEPSQPAKVDMEFKNPKPVAIAIKSVPIIDAGRFSDCQHLLRVTGYCLRFVSNALKRQKILDQSLLPEGIRKAKDYWMKIAQRDLQDAEKKFSELSPIILNGVIRVGGRLGRSNLSYDKIHPVLLPADYERDT